MPEQDSKLDPLRHDLHTELPSSSIPRILVLAAHPDDETIGASAVISRSSEVWVVYLSDGAPQDANLRSRPSMSRQEYARVRELEARSALQLAGVPPERILQLGGVDQETAYMLGDLVHRFVQISARICPDRILTHAYEGGHPDHDSAAFVAATGVQLLQLRQAASPVLLEMTSYHAENGRCMSGRFLPGQDQGWPIVLSPEEVLRKKEMMACYVSQIDVLQGFSLAPERLRLAPQYDFLRSPHRGKVWYECLGWPMTAARWCELARHAMQPNSRGRAA